MLPFQSRFLKALEARQASKQPRKRRGLKALVHRLSNIMAETGRGYRRHTMNHSGRDDDRRKDKLDAIARGQSQEMRRYQQRYQSPNARRGKYPFSSRRAG